MKRRALIVGSQTHGLEGVENDILCMQDLLAAYSFEIDNVVASRRREPASSTATSV